MKPLVAAWQTKFVLSAAGALGLSAGAFIAIALYSQGGAKAAAPLAAFLVSGAGGVAGAFLAVWAVDAALGEAAAHVDVLKVVFYQASVALLLSLADAALLRIRGRSLPSRLETLALWAGGVAAIWQDEPGGINWRSLAAALRDLRLR